MTQNNGNAPSQHIGNTVLVVTMEVDEYCDSQEVFGHSRFFEDPMMVAAGTFEALYSKNAITEREIVAGVLEIAKKEEEENGLI